MTDVLIIGAGISGMTAALITSDGGLSVRLIDKAGVPHTLQSIPHFNTLPIFYSFTPSSLVEAMTEEVSRHGIELTSDKVCRIEKRDDIFSVICDRGVYNSRFVIIAAGNHHDIICPYVTCTTEISEECRAPTAGLMLCGNARRPAGLLRCMSDGIVCGETAKEWIYSHNF